MIAPPSSSHYRLAGSQLTHTSSPINAGTLIVVDENGKPTGKKRKISSHHEVVIGRDSNKCHWTFDDPYMSHKHLRLYVVVFEDDDFEEALVYAEDLSRNGCHWNGSLMGKKNDAFLLSDGDRLRLTSKTSLVFHAHCPDVRNHFDLVQEREMQTFCSKYVVTDRLLGSGAFGSVFMAIEQTSRTQLACKMVDLRRISHTKEQPKSHQEPRSTPNTRARSELRNIRIWADKQKRQIPLEKNFNAYMREFEILSSINHPNIIALDKVFVTDNNIYVFQDLVTAGDLFSYIESKNHKLLEIEAAVIIRQVLIAVRHLHEQNIAHRDIKPENIMLTSLATGSRVVLTDFGSARHILPMQRATTFAGTEEYGAPEMMNQRSKFFSKRKNISGYSLAIDMWSVGTISTLLLVGFRAFDNHDGRHDPTLALRAELGRLEEDPGWRSLGERPKNFVRMLLVLDEIERLTARQALEHPWFSNEMHKIDFDELYQRTIKNWRPKIPNLPLIKFVSGKCYEVECFESSQKILAEQRPLRRRCLTPAEPPYKPFYRKVYDQTGLWPPKRRRSYGMSQEQKKAIEEWNEAMSEPPSPILAVAECPRNLFTKPEMPSKSRQKFPTASGLLQWTIPQRTPKKDHNRLPHKGSAIAIRDLDKRLAAQENAADPSSVSLPLRSSLARSSSFRNAAPSDLLAAGVPISKFTATNAARTKPSTEHSYVQSSGTPHQYQTWSLHVRSRSRLKSRTNSTNTAPTTLPLKRRGGSVFDIENEAENKGETRLETPREARDNVLMTALDDTIVSPHNVHLRLDTD